MEAVHERGIVFNDLHIFNVIVAPDEESVFLIDFEAAAPAEENGRQVVAHPGFFAPPDRRGIDVDRYALACLRLALFLPVTTLFVVDRGKAAHLAEVIAGQFPDVPREFLDKAVTEITRGTDPIAPAFVRPGDWPYSRDSMVKAILASATPDRDDRLFPGDVAQFSDGGGLGLAHGAAGVLYALDATGADRHEEGERWLLDRTAPPPVGTPLGLYDGLAGVAHVLDRLGHRQRALDLIDGILAERWQNLSSTLHGGLAGLGLVLGQLAADTGESELRERAAEAADILVRRLAESRPASPGGGPGCCGVRAGPRCSWCGSTNRQATSGCSTRQLPLCARILSAVSCSAAAAWRSTRAGGRCRTSATEASVWAWSWTISWPISPMRQGSSSAPAPKILTAATSRFYAQPGLFQGRAGMILHLARTTAPGSDAHRLAEQVAGLGWFAMSYEGQLAFPGHQMMRLSMDLGTGTAGCLLALGAALGDAESAPGCPSCRRSGGPQARLRDLTES